MALPQQYPDVPPLILFTSDIFHPLVTPLTTYTYTTGSASTDTVSATDEDRLLPGAFSLRHGFPKWFERNGTTPALPILHDTDHFKGEGGQDVRRPLSFHIPPPKEDGFSADDVSPSIVEVLYYLKNAFGDERLLDDLPLEAAANPGAWNAWRAHRKRKRESHKRSTSESLNSPTRAKPTGDWNWDGVWAERVKRGVSTSLSDQLLYGSVDGHDIVSSCATRLCSSNCQFRFIFLKQRMILYKVYARRCA